ncbi:hypothetical protein CHUAL_012454 [Chamberlinius hualienensis]
MNNQPQWNLILDEVNTVEELNKLKRIYRISENERKAYQRDTVLTLLKQKAVIRQLEKKKEEILLKFSVENNKLHDKKDRDVAARLYEIYREKREELQNIRSNIEEQKKQIATAEKELKALKREYNDLDVYHKIKQTSKKIKSLEDKLENAFGRYNRVSHKMSKQKQCIEHLVHEKNTHKSIWQQMQRQLNSCKRQMDHLMTSATHSYNKREELYQRFLTLKKNQKGEQKLCWAQLQEAERAVKNQTHISNFMSIKNKRRTYKELTITNEQLADLSFGQPTKQSTADETNSTFEMFSYTCNLCGKYESLQLEVKKLKEELESVQELDSQSAQRSESSCKELEDQSSILASESAELEKYVNQMKKTMPSLKYGIESMLTAVGGNSQVLTSMEPESENPDLKILLVDALQEIENKVNQILHTKLFFESQVKERESSMQLRSTTTNTVGFIQSFQPNRKSEELTDMLYVSIPRFDDSSEYIPVHSSTVESSSIAMENLKDKSKLINFDRLKLL